MLKDLRKALAAAGTAAKAKQMQAYMKSTMPYHGVPAPVLRPILKAQLDQHHFGSARGWRREVLALWDDAEFREERYAAIALLFHRRAKAFRDLSLLPTYQKLIVEGAWWDYVDTLASNGVGELLRLFPHQMKPKMREWSTDDDFWLRRTSIISQLKFKEATDLKLLYGCIEPSLGSKEFFLRKAIGWALRQYAWTDDAEIRRYVAANEPRLSGLSKREALKNLA